MSGFVLGYLLGVGSVAVAAWTRVAVANALAERIARGPGIAPLRELDSADVLLAFRRGRR